jgi:HD superfamily phosphohydrolase
MHFNDRVYGYIELSESPLLDLIRTPTFQRLRGIRQAGPSALAYPFKVVTRFEHSIGVFVLLRTLGASQLEQVAGLLHDISHTAFSHAVDFVYESEEQDHHEEIKAEFLHRPDLARALAALGYRPDQFEDDSIYGLLERPLPALCADRIDYFLRDGLTCGVLSPQLIASILASLIVIDGSIGLTDRDTAIRMRDHFAIMNNRWWASPAEAYIYNEFADAMRLAMQAGTLHREDFLLDDQHVLACLRSARHPLIREKLHRIHHFNPDCAANYTPRVPPKQRIIDPPVLHEGALVPLSRLVPVGGCTA